MGPPFSGGHRRPIATVVSTLQSPRGDYQRFCAGVRQVCGVDLGQYRPAQMERRLRSFAERSGHRDLDEYLTQIRRDPAARRGFLDRMTINVSELFRNPERFAELERTRLPELVAASPRGLRVWSAACSYGAEPYSLAILLREALPGGAHTVRATDIDRTILARAREGVFAPADMRNVSSSRRARWFAERADGTVQASPALRESVTFSRLDLLADRYPAGNDLILCRNVVIYFTADAKAQVYANLRAALRSGGILMVGSTESIADAERNGWEKAGTFFYRRVDQRAESVRPTPSPAAGRR